MKGFSFKSFLRSGTFNKSLSKDSDFETFEHLLSYIESLGNIERFPSVVFERFPSQIFTKSFYFILFYVE